jgi:hypothetical protein
MAATSIKTSKKTITGTGVPADGDRISTDVTAFPLGTVYINRTTGFVYVRKAVAGVAADWQTGDA